MRRASSLRLLARARGNRALGPMLWAALAVCGCQDVGRATQIASNPVQQDSGRCGDIALSGRLRVAPTDPGRRYLRCGTRGGEVRWRVALSSDHARIAARTNAGTVRLIATQPWSELVELAAPLGRIDALAFAPDGETLATFSIESGQVAIWRASDGSLVRTYSVRTSSRQASPRGAALVYSRDAQQIAVSTQRVLDLATGSTRAWSYRAGQPEPDFKTLTFMADDGTLLADGLYRERSEEISETLMLITPGGGDHVVLFAGFASLLQGVAVSPDRTQVAFASGDPRRPGLFVYALGEAAPVAADPAIDAQVLAYSPDGAQLYLAQDDVVSVRDARSLAEISRFAWSPDSRFLGLSPTGDLVAASASETFWWAPSTGTVRRRIPEALADLAFSQDGVLGAGSGVATLARIWSEQDGSERCNLPQRDAARPELMAAPVVLPASYASSFSGRVSVVAQSRDGTVLATRSEGTEADSWITLIEAGTNRTLRTFANNPSVVYAGRGAAVALSDDGTEAYTLEAEGMLGHDPYVAVWCREGQDRGVAAQ